MATIMIFKLFLNISRFLSDSKDMIKELRQLVDLTTVVSTG